MVHGSLSVVHQLHKLVMQKCLRIVARVVEVVDRGGGDDNDDDEVRVVVLVDVYLPIALWSGWQFPKSGPAAAALFRHVRCACSCRYLRDLHKSTAQHPTLHLHSMFLQPHNSVI